MILNKQISFACIFKGDRSIEHPKGGRVCLQRQQPLSKFCFHQDTNATSVNGEAHVFTSANQNLLKWMLGASRGIVSILMRICRCVKLAGILHHVALIDRLLHQLRASEGKITHLCEEHREDSQADPVDDAGKLERITDCSDERNNSIIIRCGPVGK